MRTRIDLKRLGQQILIFLFILMLGLLNLKAQPFYSEDFSSCQSGTITAPNWDINISNGTPDVFWVQSQRFECRNIRGEGVWRSSLMDISAYSRVNLSVLLSENGQMEEGDYIRAYYNVDGKREILFSESGNMEGRFGSVIARQLDISGADLQIIVRVRNNEINEKHTIDNVLVETQQQILTWTGYSDSLWNNPANWSAGTIPTINDDVLISKNAPVYPVVVYAASCSSISIEKHAELRLQEDAEMNILGNLKCDGIFIPGKSTVHFCGSESQLIDLSPFVRFYNLSINNRSDAGITTIGNIEVLNRLHLAKGDLVTSDTVKILNMGADAISGYSSASYIAGKLQRKISNSGEVAYHFPIGGGGKINYHPARIDVNSLSGTNFLTISFEQIPQTATGKLNIAGSEFTYVHRASEGMWIVTPDNEPATGWYDIRLSLENINGLADNLFGIVKRPKGADEHSWTSDFGTDNVFGGEGRKLSDGYAIKKYCTTFSEFTLAGGGTGIPIELLDFKAELTNGKVQIDWSTATETENLFFTIEKSNGADFKEVARVEGSGNSSTMKTYSATDEKPYTGVSYYRLKQTDSNGKEEYSDVVSVKNVTDNQLVVFPNPSEGTIKLKFNSALPKVEVVIYNQHGTVSFNKTFLTQGATSVLDLNLKEELVSGVYYLQVSANGQDMLIQQVVIQ